MNSPHQNLPEDWSRHMAEENKTHFRNALIAAMERTIPHKTTGKQNNIPWITDAAKQSIAKWDRAFKNAKGRNSPRRDL